MIQGDPVSKEEIPRGLELFESDTPAGQDPTRK